MTAWTRVADRLPAPGPRVLVYFGDGLMACADYADGWWDYENAEGEPPTHWMPLPNAPVEECASATEPVHGQATRRTE